jgi:hypothetical protein
LMGLHHSAVSDDFISLFFKQHRMFLFSVMISQL